MPLMAFVFMFASIRVCCCCSAFSTPSFLFPSTQHITNYSIILTICWCCSIFYYVNEKIFEPEYACTVHLYYFIYACVSPLIHSCSSHRSNFRSHICLCSFFLYANTMAFSVYRRMSWLFFCIHSLIK